MRDKTKQRDWVKNNYHNVVGLRPIGFCEVITETCQRIVLTEKDFLYRRRGETLYRLLYSVIRVHFPRSLGRRVRVTLDSNNNIKSETNKCFGKICKK